MGFAQIIINEVITGDYRAACEKDTRLIINLCNKNKALLLIVVG